MKYILHITNSLFVFQIWCILYSLGYGSAIIVLGVLAWEVLIAIRDLLMKKYDNISEERYNTLEEARRLIREVENQRRRR